MNLYPMMANLQGRDVLVVGGGGVATRKVKTLAGTGADIRVVSPAITEELQALADAGKITVIRRDFSESDLEGAAIVFAATDDPDLNARVSRQARTRNIPVNDIIHPELCSFFVPSHVRRGDLILAISTSGKSPALARWLRERLEEEFGLEYQRLADWMGTLRGYLLRHGYTHEQIRDISRTLLRENLVETLKTGDRKALADALETAFRTVLNRPVPPDLTASLESS